MTLDKMLFLLFAVNIGLQLQNISTGHLCPYESEIVDHGGPCLSILPSSISIKNQSILKRINCESYVFLNIYGGNGLKL